MKNPFRQVARFCLVLACLYTALLFREGHRYKSFWIGLWSAKDTELLAERILIFLLLAFVFSLFSDQFDVED